MITIENAILRDKLYFYKKDVDKWGGLLATFSYVFDKKPFTLLGCIDKEQELYALPANVIANVRAISTPNLKDERVWEKLTYDFDLNSSLRVEQQKVVDLFKSGRSLKSGILQAPCGWGKTYTACSFIHHANVKTIVIVHTRLLFYQWINFLKIALPNVKIGRVGDGLYEIEDVTVSIYKSLNNNLDALKDTFSLAIVDEVHLCPAEVFSVTLNSLSTKVRIGMSATPKRRDGKHIFLSDYFSSFMVRATDSRQIKVPRVETIVTDIPFHITNPKRDWARALTRLCSDSRYIELIAEKAIIYASNRRCVLIVSERLNMLEELEKRIPDSIRVIGNTPEEKRQEILTNAGTKYKVLLTTKIFDEGISCHRLDTLILTCPSGNEIRLEQRIGRILREHPDKKHPLVVDFWLTGVIVRAQQYKRIAWYKQKGFIVNE